MDLEQSLGEPHIQQSKNALLPLINLNYTLVEDRNNRRRGFAGLAEDV